MIGGGNRRLARQNRRDGNTRRGSGAARRTTSRSGSETKRGGPSTRRASNWRSCTTFRNGSRGAVANGVAAALNTIRFGRRTHVVKACRGVDRHGGSDDRRGGWRRGHVVPGR